MYKKKIVILIDGNSYLYRIYYAKYKKIKENILCTKVIYSMLYILKNIFLTYKPNNLIVVFDSKSKNFRKKIFNEYKANRTSMPNLLKLISSKFKKILINIGIPIISIPTFEADDVIGTLSKDAEKNKEFVLIATCDKDLAQLVNKNIYILNHLNNKIFNIQKIKKKYGVTPDLIIDFLALTGDQSDNIPGVKGIGKKTAIILINKIGGINKIYKNISNIVNYNIKGQKNIIKKLIKGKKMAFLSYQLSKIKSNIILKQKYKTINLLSIFCPCKSYNIQYIHIIYKLKNIILKNTEKYYK
ncbi:5'-3' exonuclease H3TH domain-containing protein [Buchnera aphidicola]|uniref:5'-3' exonuclease domain-containing protein n=1 Tax=Buchnera aphidicola (Sarucallis kahawaluokalani) TaxID=1241878 RepID=A0A4D6YK50_9GAMM|nr:5'-3' exonuclease H3TH domain-containing protein [Buchnera aphidicola]QCI26068.1 hypothetical protein D9V78_01435 [Buchnera aphidicola (Sarucallis kahawaluokalani)]